MRLRPLAVETRPAVRSLLPRPAATSGAWLGTSPAGGAASASSGQGTTRSGDAGSAAAYVAADAAT